uniref:Uncharacterized protein n=1 Tax=Accipiter nisus TaxID=211598 RepID=A0A8B9NSU1_9AVES
MSEKHKWDKGLGKGNVKYHLKVTVRGVKHFSGLIYNTEGVPGNTSRMLSYTENAEMKTVTTMQHSQLLKKSLRTSWKTPGLVN